MRGLLWNLLLALAWAAITPNFTVSNLAIGFLLGFIILVLAQRFFGMPNYTHKVRKALGLLIFFLYELILANLRVAFEVLTPTLRIRPGVIAVPLDVKSDAGITLLAMLITLTPGSFTLDISPDRRFLYIHAMHIEDPEALSQWIKDGFERRVREVVE